MTPVTAVVHKRNAYLYTDIIDDAPEPFYDEEMGNIGDEWVEFTLDNPEQVLVFHTEALIMIGYQETEDSKLEYKLMSGPSDG